MGSWRSEGRRLPVSSMCSRACLNRRTSHAGSRSSMSSSSCGVVSRGASLRRASHLRFCAARCVRFGGCGVRAGRLFHLMGSWAPGFTPSCGVNSSWSGCAGTSDRTRNGQEQPEDVRRMEGTSIFSCDPSCPLGPLGFECSQQRQPLCPSVDGVRSEALRPFLVFW